MRAPTGWRIICAGAASAPRWWWGCAWSARRRWSLGCWPSSRPAAPICRWIRPIRASGWPSCSTTPARRCWSPTPRWPGGSAAHRADTVLRRCRCRGHRRPARIGPRRHARPAPSRLCHLHLRLHRNPEGSRRRSSATSCNHVSDATETIRSATTTSGRSFAYPSHSMPAVWEIWLRASFAAAALVVVTYAIGALARPVQALLRANGVTSLNPSPFAARSNGSRRIWRSRASLTSHCVRDLGGEALEPATLDAM